MFDIRITIGKIDYEKTIISLFPAALDKCRTLQNPSLLFRLFLELGEDAMPVLLGIMQQLPESAKQELLCQFMNNYHKVLTDKLNEYLQEDTLGKNFKILDLYIKQTSEGLELIGEGISIDYKTLLESENVRFKINKTASDALINFGGIGKIFANHAGDVLKKAVETVPRETEKLGLKLIQRQDIKDKLKNLAQTMLQKKELILELKTLSFIPVCDVVAVQSDKIVSRTIKISSKLETQLVKALAAYLRMSVTKTINPG